ncbi:hypothetical protein Pla22_24240 [Rubripirellula amarantea]|uniref:Uncharacterized protein n=1 Tax=Rubripirellula amarantea TaxID=2527999 RepID=A0A5C5WXD2_9BACT|nr:hypothetical protein Pla22_24240 [Rubripirellula amarantea]
MALFLLQSFDVGKRLLQEFLARKPKRHWETVRIKLELLLQFKRTVVVIHRQGSVLANRMRASEVVLHASERGSVVISSRVVFAKLNQ